MYVLRLKPAHAPVKPLPTISHLTLLLWCIIFFRYDFLEMYPRGRRGRTRNALGRKRRQGSNPCISAKNRRVSSRRFFFQMISTIINIRICLKSSDTAKASNSNIPGRNPHYRFSRHFPFPLFQRLQHKLCIRKPWQALK